MTGKVRGYLYLGAAALLVFVAWRIYATGHEDGSAEVRGQWSAELAATLQAQAEELTQARDREQRLQAALERQREEYRREINSITFSHNRLVDSLRERTEERAGPSGVPEGAASGVGCTGAGLARPDAGFLAGYAADAARLRAALETCVAQYNAVRDQVNRD
jgi:hypothetical protein